MKFLKDPGHIIMIFFTLAFLAVGVWIESSLNEISNKKKEEQQQLRAEQQKAYKEYIKVLKEKKTLKVLAIERCIKMGGVPIDTIRLDTGQPLCLNKSILNEEEEKFQKDIFELQKLSK